TEALVELSDAAALVQLTRAAGPCRVALRVDIQSHGIAFLAPGGAGFEDGAVSHLHLDHVVVWVNIRLHSTSPCKSRSRPATQFRFKIVSRAPLECDRPIDKPISQPSRMSTLTPPSWLTP